MLKFTGILLLGRNIIVIEIVCVCARAHACSPLINILITMFSLEVPEFVEIDIYIL